MALIDPASISLGASEEQEEEEEGETEVLDTGCVPTVGASVVIQDNSSPSNPQENMAESAEMQSYSVDDDSLNQFQNESQPASFASPNSMSQIIPKAKVPLGARGTLPGITVDQISDPIYADFVVLMTGGEVVPVNDEHGQILDAMVQGNDYTVACDVEDEFLGHLDYVIVHLTSMRLVLMSEQRQQVMEAVVTRFKNDKHPIGSCLQVLQRNYIGFPPVIKLRNALMECLSRLVVEGEDDVDYVEADYVQPEAQEFSGEEGSGDSTINIDDSTDKKKGLNAHLLNSAIPDNEYDILAQILMRKVKVDEVENVIMRAAIKQRMKGGHLVGEYWSEPNEFLSSGWRIRIRDSGKVVPRISEVDEIWRRCYEMMPDCSQKQVHAYLEERYAGINNRGKQRFAYRDILLRGPRVQFPNRPRCIGSKPMQYVQVDMVEMECSVYGDRCYTMALIVMDLYSHFVFGRALAETPDTSLLVRHLMDIFGAFSPPEAYRTYTNDEVIGNVMSDIEKLFKIEIKNIGHGVMNHSQLCASMYKRAAEELGGRERWVEALPFAVIDYNQTPVKCFGDLRISPFEIMFGRRPWRNDSIPPWVRNDLYEEHEDEIGSYMEGSRMDSSGATEMCMIRTTALPRRPEVEERLANVYLSEMSSNRAKISCILGRYPAKFNEEGQVVDPGTGYLYDVGDCVYLRNSDQQDGLTDRTKRHQNEPRYYRATIVEVDYQNPDFMYRVCYWDDIVDVDRLPPDQWPDEGSLSAWVSPYDIAASTFDLARRRNVVRRQEMEFQCKCGHDFCELKYSPNCSFKFSQACCQRLKMNCSYHSQFKAPSRELKARLKNQATPVLRMASGGERRLITIPRRIRPQVDHSSSRWVFQGGRYIELFPSSSNAAPLVGRRDDRLNDVHFDYDIGAFSSKRRRLQTTNTSTPASVYDGNPSVSRLPLERSYGYQTVELYETKDNFIIPSAHELEGMGVDDDSNDIASNGHVPVTLEASNEPVYHPHESKGLSRVESGGNRQSQTEPSIFRAHKRTVAPPRRLSPT